MKNLLFVIPVLVALAGAYLLMQTIGAGEAVELLPGHQVPKGLTGMIGAVGIFGAIAIAVELLNKRRKGTLQPATRE